MSAVVRAEQAVRCRSWRIRAWRIVRCSWPREHVRTSKWHCAETTTGHVWYVRDRERHAVLVHPDTQETP